MKKRYMIFFVFISFFLLSLLNSRLSTATSISCLNFKIRNDYGVYFGNNEDHAIPQISNTIITFIPNGSVWYDESTIMYGAAILGYTNVSGLSWFQGGMNEKGLAWDSTSVPHTTPNLHSERPQNLVPEIFSCESITEVIDYKAAHGVYQEEGSVQSMYLDITGESVVFNIGIDGEFDFFRNNETFQLSSNYYYNDTSRGNPSSDAIRRYNAAERKLKDINASNPISIESITKALDAAHFEGPQVNTLYSNIFDVKNGIIYLYYFHQFGEVVILNLEEELAKGWHSYRICDLFSQDLVDQALHEYHDYSILIRFFPTDIVLLFVTIFLDIIICVYTVFLIIKGLFHKIGKSKQVSKLKTDMISSKGLRMQAFLSLGIIWSLLSFSMIYWNRSGEWWPFFDDIPILQLPLLPFYSFYNFFLLISVLSIFLIAFLLFSFGRKGELILLLKSGLTLGKEKKWRLIVNFSIPILIGIVFLILEQFNFISKVDWLMFIIMYPLIVAMLMILIPLTKKKATKDQNDSKDRSRIYLIKADVLLILTWTIWFLPLLLTGILDHMYILILLDLSISLFIVTCIEFFINYRKHQYNKNESSKLPINLKKIKT
ncbi:MAG: hypothetical protein ACFFFT_10635 [Candidatus Thorarchaeota archaeon]